MLLNIVLTISLLSLVYYDFVSVKNLKIKPETRVVINLKRGINLSALIFIGLMLYVVVTGYRSQSYSTYPLAISLAIALLVAKISFLNPKRLLINEKDLQMNIGRIPLESVDLFTINEKGRLKVQFGGVRAIEFKLNDAEEYEKVLYCVEKLNIGNSQEIIKAHRLAQLCSKVRGIYPIQGVVKDYAWGGNQYIAKILNIQPTLAAELWFGTHPQGISVVEVSGKELNHLAQEFYKKNPEQSGLTVNTSENYYVLLNFMLAYGQRVKNSDEEARSTLPFMFKILDVAKPLSIQLHPDMETAIRGFENEVKQKKPLDAFDRVFKDRLDKPELMIALSDFYLLHGLNTKKNILDIISSKPTLAKFTRLVSENSLIDAISYLYTADQEEFQEYFLEHAKSVIAKYGKLCDAQLELADIQEEITVDGINSTEVLLDPDYWVAFTIKSLNMELNTLDVGLTAFYMYNLVKLHRGQAIFQSPNVPHAYLRGQNTEILANCDNVVRGGLTNKFIAKNLFLELMDKEPLVPYIFEAGVYDIDDFGLSATWKEFNTKGESYHVNNLSFVYIERGNGKASFSNIDNQPTTIELKEKATYLLTANQDIKFIGDMTCIFSSAPDDVFEDPDAELEEVAENARKELKQKESKESKSKLSFPKFKK